MSLPGHLATAGVSLLAGYVGAFAVFRHASLRAEQEADRMADTIGLTSARLQHLTAVPGWRDIEGRSLVSDFPPAS
jgi:hypothetical protein